MWQKSRKNTNFLAKFCYHDKISFKLLALFRKNAYLCTQSLARTSEEGQCDIEDFDKKYGRGNKYYSDEHKEYFFDIDAFQNGYNTDYINPRKGNQSQGTGDPIHGSESSVWDYFGPILTITALTTIISLF